MKLQMPVDRIVITGVGHTIKFEKDVPRDVPAAAVKDCLMNGAHVIQGVLDVPAPPKQEELEVVGPERDAAIAKQMEKMIARNLRTDFTGTGKPDVFVINKDVGFVISAQERDKIWDEVRQKLAAENEPPKNDEAE